MPRKPAPELGPTVRPVFRLAFGTWGNGMRFILGVTPLPVTWVLLF